MSYIFILFLFLVILGIFISEERNIPLYYSRNYNKNKKVYICPKCKDIVTTDYINPTCIFDETELVYFEDSMSRN